MTAINKIAVLKDSLLQIGASLTRSRRAKKHLDKIGDDAYIKAQATIIHHQELLYESIFRDLRNEQRKVKELK